MSEQRPSGPPAAKPRRDPMLTVLMIVGGGVLLFPGLCTLYFFAGDIVGDGSVLYQALHIWLAICFLIGVGGVALIVRAIRR